MVEPARLREYSLFGGLLEGQIQQILPLMETVRYRAREEIIQEGTPNDKIRFILEGRIEIVKGGVKLAEFGVGETFGEMEVLDVMPSVATVRALTDTAVLSISNRNLRDIYKADLQCFSLMIMNLARDLSRKLRHMDERAEEESRETAPPEKTA
ncbi:MAG: cyclic nucleotide-binding domain-containing protein [Treponema sp.]|jgi:CRP-like cAMP-binding protein|nr:cyclic nucleotide-binding domain-containing protein [Treponema sp.]